MTIPALFRNLILGLTLGVTAQSSLDAKTTPSKIRHPGPVKTVKDAREIAERETGGRATAVRRISLNGASGGWEVHIHMPNEEKGWKCIVDADTRTVYTKDRIPNPDGRKKP